MTSNQIAYWNYVEEKRHNEAMERENKRSNVAREIETNRANLATEGLKSRENEIRAESNIISREYNTNYLKETQRAHQATEELTRSAQQLESQRILLGYEQTQTNREVAQIQAGVGYANVGATYANIAEQSRANIARETENTRHNIMSEQTANRQVSVGRLNASAAMKSAQARLSSTELESQKWNDPLMRASRQQSYFQQAEGFTNQQNLLKSQTFNQTAQGGSTIARTASQIARDVMAVGSSLLGGAK